MGLKRDTYRQDKSATPIGEVWVQSPPAAWYTNFMKDNVDSTGNAGKNSNKINKCTIT